MAYTYNIPVTVRGGRRAVWDSEWDGSGAYEEQVVGIMGSAWYQSSMMFDMSSVSGKTITGITLKLTVASGTIPADGTQNYPICYKADSSTTSWKRSSTTAVNGKYIRNQTAGGGTITANNTVLSIDMGTTLPTYGYVAGPRASSLSSSFKYVKLASTATLAVTTNETYREYTLAYDANDGSGAPSSTSAGNIQVNPSCTFTVSSTVPTRTGYDFLGWSTSRTATSASYVGGNSITVTTAGTTTLYAVWKLKTYTVAYNKGSNGTGTNSTATKTYNVTLALKGAQFTRTGYTQTGWATSDGGAQAYALSANYTANASVTLYPVWTLNTYQVSYNANSGTGAPGAQTKSYGVTLTLSSTKPTRASASAGSYTVSYNGNGASNPTASTANRTTSYAFSNWNTAANGSGTSYASGGSYTANAAATLYAQWTATTTTASVTLPTITRTGYRFDGWFTAQTGGTQVTSPYTPGGNVTLYAHWTATASTVSAPNGTIGSALAITITRGSTNSYTHDLSYSFGSLSNQSIATGVGTSYSWSIPYTLAAQYPNATSASCTITCVTKNGSTVIGTTTTTITLSIPYYPTISSFTASPVSTNSAVTNWGIYLKGYSRVKLDVVAAAGSGASITKIEFSGTGISQSGSSTTAKSAVLSSVPVNTKLDYTVTVTDSRGRKTSLELKNVSGDPRPSFYDYAPPVINGIGVARCKSNGGIDNSAGGFLAATPSFTFSSIGGRNSISSSVLSYKIHGSGSTIASKSGVTNGTTYKAPGTSWAVTAGNAYDVTLVVADAVYAAASQTVPFTTILPGVQGIWFGKGNDRLGLGGVPPFAGLHCDWNATFNGVLDVTQRRCYAMLPTANKWYRAFKVPFLSGSFFKISIGANTMLTREITFSIASGSNVAFMNETSKSTVNYINAIRVWNAGNNVLYVDIHASSAISSTAPMVQIEPYGVIAENEVSGMIGYVKIESMGLVAVDDAPTGSLLAEYTFAENTITDVSSAFSFNTSKFSGLTGRIYALYNARDKTVELNVALDSPNTNIGGGSTNVFITCSDSRYAPKTGRYYPATYVISSNPDYTYFAQYLYIFTTGEVWQNDTNALKRCAFHVTYEVN